MKRTIVKILLVPAALGLLSAVAFSQKARLTPDPKAVLEAYFAKAAKFQTISGSYFMVGLNKGLPSYAGTGSFEAKSPRSFRLEMPGVTAISDGNHQLMLDRKSHMAQSMPAGDKLPGFFSCMFPDPTSNFSSVTSEEFQGKSAIHLTRSIPFAQGVSTLQYWIDAVTLTPIAYQAEDDLGAKGKYADFYGFQSVKFNVPLAAADFSQKLPAGIAMAAPPPKPFAVGSAAPKIALLTPEGAPVSLANELKTHKCVIVNFWFVNCSFCRQEFPHLEAIYEKLKPQGLEVLAVNQGFDKSEDIVKFMGDQKLTFPALVNQPKSKLDAVNAYRVTAFPTNYLITPDGKVSAVVTGFGGDKSVAEMEDALRKVGFHI